MEQDKEHWDIVIEPRGSNFSLNLGEVWKYRDLLVMYIRRDVVTIYKQTVLGPLWYLIQPLFTSLIQMLVFTFIAKISTDGLPPILFYLMGNMCWSYFGECLGRSSSTFSTNASVFSKVYFPRLVVPLASIVSNLVKLAMQFILFAGFYIYFVNQGYEMRPNEYILLLPLLIALLAGLGFGVGIIISSMTVKYRDVAIFFGFVIGLWMYVTPIMYPLSYIPIEYAWLFKLNPLTAIVEAVRYGLTGSGLFSWNGLAYSTVWALGIMLVGTWMFNKVERKFIDVV